MPVKYRPARMLQIRLKARSGPVRFLLNRMMNSVTVIVSAKITGIAINKIRFHGWLSASRDM
ncbi:hypothetical protein D3C73_1510840 [compost metagenome]